MVCVLDKNVSDNKICVKNPLPESIYKCTGYDFSLYLYLKKEQW